MVNKKRKKVFRIRYLFIVGLMIYLSSVYASQHKIVSQLKTEEAEREKEILQLEEDISAMEEKIIFTDSLEYIERIAREELKMVKSDELIFIDKDKSKNKFIEGIGH